MVMLSRIGVNTLQSVSRGYSLCTLRFATSSLIKRRVLNGNHGDWRSITQAPQSTAFRHMVVLNSHSKATDDTETKAKAASTGFSITGKFYQYRDLMKGMVDKYGRLFVGTYLGLYLSCLGGVFFALSNDMLNASSLGVDPVEAVHKACDIVEKITGYGGLGDFIRRYPSVGTLAISWVLTKTTEPLRLPLAVAITPSIARALGRTGVPSSPAK
jgi:hypothetical protein